MEENGSSGERVARVPPAGDERILTPAQEQCLAHIRTWVETEAEFNGRTDDEFLYMFLFGCKFNVEQIKKKMCKYYKTRREFPQWCANRDLKDPELLALLQLKITVVLKDQGPNHPVIHLTKMSKLPDAKRFDLLIKLAEMNTEVMMRRMGAQMIGIHWFIDAIDHPLWVIAKLLSPILLRDLLTSFLLALPLRVKSVALVNSPPIANTIWALVRPFLTQKIKSRVHIYRSDWTQIFEHIDRDCIPEEYGGNAGPLALHEEAYIEELLSYSDYFSEDNQYGYL